MAMNTEAGMSVPKPRFDPTINWGHILTALTIFVMAIGSIVAGTRIATNFDHRLDAMEKSLASIAPEIRAEAKLNARQEDRLDAQAEAIKGIRTDNAEINKKMGVIGESMVGMKTQIDTLIRRN